MIEALKNELKAAYERIEQLMKENLYLVRVIKEKEDK